MHVGDIARAVMGISKGNIMQQTIIGFFNSASDAEKATQRLKESGFAETDIDVSTGHTTGESDTPYGVSDESRYAETGTGTSTRQLLNEDVIRDRKGDDETGIGDSIGRFFRNLFDNKEDAERFATAGRKNSIVSVYAETSELAEQARDILDDCGAVDIDEEQTDTQNSGWRGSSLGNYTDTTDKDELSPDVNSNRESAGADAGEKNVSPAGDYVSHDEGGTENKKTRTRSRIVDRRVDEDFRLRQRSDSADFRPTEMDAEKLSGNNKSEEKI
jgi:hypothetical protein